MGWRHWGYKISYLVLSGPIHWEAYREPILFDGVDSYIDYMRKQWSFK